MYPYANAGIPHGKICISPIGYNYESRNIFGFVHMHIHEGPRYTTVNGPLEISLLPATGSVLLKQATKENLESGYGSAFSDERKHVGYYSVLLDRYGVRAELVATGQVGFHKYTFTKHDNPHILFDLSDVAGWSSTAEAYLKLEDASTLVGYRFSKFGGKDQKLFFAAKLSRSVSKFEIYDSISLQKGKEAKGLNIKGVLYFEPFSVDPVMIKVGISTVSNEDALKNIEAEIPDWDFEKIEQYNSKIQIRIR
ncbi:hypothetical protein NF867_03880 [Solitalea sp. MAHUQ-68]|uniref:Glycosyl hydrolase family 92 N-terminal domain-containing protein n=1 Tax=Solitalea agri TaxID=2953739 RepID=A0A9X2JCN8_9SPHI|nr:hypothetical protein [Solitalea agri]MCO4292000.1 hypothetical protein [Solitalea agri]